MTLIALLMLLTSASLDAAPRQAQLPLELVPDVDLSRYAGLWYEVARLPNRFQDDCAGDVTAMYTQRSDGRIDVVNRCRKADGTFARGRGRGEACG